MKCQFDAFADYVTEAEKQGTESYPLYAWTAGHLTATGYWLYRLIKSLGHECIVVAPSLSPRSRVRWSITRPALVDHRVIRLPRSSLCPLVHRIDDAVLRPIPCGTGVLNLLRSYVDALFQDPVLTMPDVRQLLVSQLCDLVAVTLGATRDAAAAAEGRGLRTARLRAIKADIEGNLADGGDLSPSAVARRQHVSESYIRKLFEARILHFQNLCLLVDSYARIACS